MEGGEVARGEARVGRESAGGRRWKSREMASAASDVDTWLGWVDGVGGGATVVPYGFGGGV